MRDPNCKACNTPLNLACDCEDDSCTSFKTFCHICMEFGRTLNTVYFSTLDREDADRRRGMGL